MITKEGILPDPENKAIFKPKLCDLSSLLK